MPSKNNFSTSCVLILLFTIVRVGFSVDVGNGSYSTSLPADAVGPQFFNGTNAIPKISVDFDQRVKTNDFWSSLIYPFYGDQHSNNIFAHPLNFKAINSGLQLGYTDSPIYAGSDYLFPFAHQLTVGIAGLNVSQTLCDEYADWTLSPIWDDGTRRLRATLGHGLPFVYLRTFGGNAVVNCVSQPSIWFAENGVLGLTVEDRHFGIFAPDGSTWTGTTALSSELNGLDYFSVALLPDNQLVTLETFRQHAYAFVIGSSVSWDYDEETALQTSTYSYETELMEDVNGNSDQTLTALYRHQWLNTTADLTAFEYTSVAGTMKVLAGNQFTTSLTFGGVLPALPDQGDYNRSELLSLLNEVVPENLPTGATYVNGKAIARFAHLVNIADQLGEIAARDHFLSEIKLRLEDWFTIGGDAEYSYNSTWDVLTGYPSDFGADNQINDHNFHSGYAIMAAAIVAQYDSVWAAQENWGGMVNLLIRDGNSWDRTDEMFPFLRSFDPYAGHSWESGHGDFGDGNNEESSSESMNFAAGVFLWGAITQQQEIRDLGIYLYTTERSAIEQYWFDIDEEVFPQDYQHKALGMIWGAKGVHSTWFGADPEFIHGINMLPITAGSFYLGRHPEYILINYAEILNELSGPPTIWQDVIWQYLSMSDAWTAMSLYYTNPDYEPFDGESRAHTYHWLGNMKSMGQLNLAVTADIPSYAVFKNVANENTYTAYNPSADSVLVSFTDGFSMNVAPRVMKSVNPQDISGENPIVVLIADKTQGKMPLTVELNGSLSFDPNDSALSFAWDFGNGESSTESDAEYTFTEIGNYSVILTVTNELFLSSQDSVLISVLANGTPFSGSPVSVPGIVQAEFYDLGGEAIAYHDNDAINWGVPFRQTEGVDIEASNDVGGGYDIGWIEDGEWVEYTIDVAEDGIYTIIPVISSVPGGGRLSIEFNGMDLTGELSVPVTGGWQFWQEMPIPDIYLNAGEQIMHVNFYNGQFNLNWIELVLTSTDKNNPPTLTADFELGQNYPNPFNPVTLINYFVPRPGQVSITLYDNLGRKLRSLVNADKTVGHHRVKCITNDLPTGIYFYQMNAEGFSRTRKMLLLK
jgi:endoglucanase Acf2/PKD repeat protein